MALTLIPLAQVVPIELDLFAALGVSLILAGNILNLPRLPVGGWSVRRKA